MSHFKNPLLQFSTRALSRDEEAVFSSIKPPHSG